MKRKADPDGLKQRSLHAFFAPLTRSFDPQTSSAAQCAAPSSGCREQDDQAAAADNNSGQQLESAGVSFDQEQAARQHDAQQQAAHEQPGGAEPDQAELAVGSQQAGRVAATQLPLGAVLRGSPAAEEGAPQARQGAALPNHQAAAALTEYELQRQERVRRNQEVMLSLGLGPTVEPQQPARPAASRPPRRRDPAAKPATAPQAVRRSGRRRGGSEAGGESSAPGNEVALPQPEEEPEQELRYDDSRVRRYVCEVLATPPTATDAGGGDMARRAGAAAPGAAAARFRRQPGCLHDPALARAYSVDWRPGLVAAGGKDGVVSVLGSAVLEGGRLAPDAFAPPLLSHKLHRGWVSDVQFATAAADGGNDSSGGGATPLLLTAGNDGVAALWDLGSAEVQAGGHGAAALPRCLARVADLHAGGIFSLHEQDGWVVTASKDGTLAVSSLGGSGGTASLAAVQQYGQLHEGVVKCARWRPCGDGGDAARVFASCGNDCRLCVVDVRQPPGGGASLAADSGHASAVNCLRWHPGCPHLLLSASHDPALLLHDLRAPGQLLHRLLGHAAGPRIGAIYQPAFVAGGAAVATGCERSQLLSLYCTASGAAISRGDAGFTPGATFCRGGLHDPLLCTAARAVHMFQPVWAADGGR